MNNRIMTISISEYIKKRIYLMMFILGLMAGTMAINTISSSYYEKINVTQDHYIEMISDVVIDKNDIMKNNMSEYYKEFALILIFNCFYFGKIYNVLYLLVKGAGIGMIISSYVMKYGVGGLMMYIISIFPHYFVYIPAIILTICAGKSMRNIITHNVDKSKQYGEGDININSIFEMIKKLGIYFIIILLFAFLVSVIEAYMNIPLYKSYIEKI